MSSQLSFRAPGRSINISARKNKDSWFYFCLFFKLLSFRPSKLPSIFFHYFIQYECALRYSVLYWFQFQGKFLKHFCRGGDCGMLSETLAALFDSHVYEIKKVRLLSQKREKIWTSGSGERLTRLGELCQYTYHFVLGLVSPLWPVCFPVRRGFTITSNLLLTKGTHAHRLAPLPLPPLHAFRIRG